MDSLAKMTQDQKVRTIFFGSGAFAVPALEALRNLPQIDLVAVISAPDRPAGRGGRLSATPLAARARGLGFPLRQPERVRADDSVAALIDLRPGLILLADYGQLIPRPLLELPPHGFLNLHPSALPRWRGASPINAAIAAGDLISAVSLIVLTERLDAGPIVANIPLALRSDDTAASFEARAALAAAELVRRALPEWLSGRLRPIPQDEERATICRPLRRSDGLLDPMRPALDLERQVRAYQPWPGSYLEAPSGRLIVWRARVAESEAGDRPGRLLSTSGGGLAFAVMGGRLSLEEVQLPGGRRMSATELRRGHPELEHSS